MELVYLLTPLYLSTKVCKYYKFLSSKCKKFWLNKVLESFWVSKSSCRIRLLDKSVKVITHFDNLKVLFPKSQSWKKIQVVHKYEWYMIFYIQYISMYIYIQFIFICFDLNTFGLMYGKRPFLRYLCLCKVQQHSTKMFFQSPIVVRK